MTGIPERLSAALADRYRIERELGAGGMATVYLAHDVKHDRKVALKVLRPELAAVVGAERFLAEIKTTASLQHPHILPLHDSGEVDGTVFYVMPFIEGESLRARLARERQLPVSEAVRIAREVASALDYAHRRGVVHRDVKPENILLHDGQALVADFGIALAVSRTEGGARLTESGVSLGTPQYMSPEQAMGEAHIDVRADVYALGCVLYEMLTGEPPFTGPGVQAIIAKVITAEPVSVGALRRTVPRNVVVATMVALNKLPADRFASTAAFAAALADPQYVGPLSGIGRRTAIGLPLTSRPALLLVGVIAVIAAGLGAAISWSLKRATPFPSVVSRFEMPLPDSVVVPGFGGGAPVFPTRDGRLLWYTPEGLYERSLDGLTSRLVSEADGADRLYIQDESPDGTELLVLTAAGGGAGGRGGRGGGGGGGAGGAMSVVPLRGGPSRALADSVDFGAWGPDGFVYFGFSPGFGPGRSGLARVPERGGAADTLAVFEGRPGQAEVPQGLTVLPGGRGLVASRGSRGAPELAAFDLRDRTWYPLGPGGPSVRYVEPGFLVYSSGRSIMVAPFDLDRLEFSQPAVPLVDVAQPLVRFTANGGVLAYRGSGSTGEGLQLAVLLREGTSEVLPNVPSGWFFGRAAVSPDGKRFVVSGTQARSPTQAGLGAGPPTSDLFVYELPAGPMSRMATPENEGNPRWLPGGREIGFTRLAADTPRTWAIVRQAWDGSGPPTVVYSRQALLGGASWLADGKGVVVNYGQGSVARGSSVNLDIGIVRFERPDSIQPLLASPAREASPAISPDGRFLAFDSDESGRREVYIRPLGGGARRQVSLNGGQDPVWGWSGRELFFSVAGSSFFAAQVRTAGELSVGAVTPLTGIPTSAAPIPGDSLFVAAVVDTLTRSASAPVVILVNLEQALSRLFQRAATPP